MLTLEISQFYNKGHFSNIVQVAVKEILTHLESFPQKDNQFYNNICEGLLYDICDDIQSFNKIQSDIIMSFART